MMGKLHQRDRAFDLGTLVLDRADRLAQRGARADRIVDDDHRSVLVEWPFHTPTRYGSLALFTNTQSGVATLAQQDTSRQQAASRYSRWSQVAWRESRATDPGCTAPPSAIPPRSGLRSSYRTPTAPPLRRGVGLAGSPTRKGSPARAGTPSTPHSLRSCGQTMALGCQPTIAKSLQDWGRDSRLSAPQEAPPKARPIDSTNSQALQFAAAKAGTNESFKGW